MRICIEIDGALMARALKVSGRATNKQTVEEALRLLVRIRRQRQVDDAFGKYRWSGNLAQSRKGRWAGQSSSNKRRPGKTGAPHSTTYR
jgi:Arc/MetJ family transcription regulator